MISLVEVLEKFGPRIKQVLLTRTPGITDKPKFQASYMPFDGTGYTVVFHDDPAQAIIDAITMAHKHQSFEPEPADEFF